MLIQSIRLCFESWLWLWEGGEAAVAFRIENRIAITSLVCGSKFGLLQFQSEYAFSIYLSKDKLLPRS
jgi:hypothetical protein